MRYGLSRATNREKNRNSLTFSLALTRSERFWRVFLLRVVDFIVLNLETLKTRLVKLDLY
ncbi:hypothetical protein EAY20_19045 [Escherichia coli]|nr:hypothetical protein [Escherichia coli]EEW3236428.1 hypothetical protein [Escherichia coli]MBE0012470.1 hypothetical protein [Raoultella planticola]